MPGRREAPMLCGKGAAALPSRSHARMRSLFGAVLCTSEAIPYFSAVGANVHLSPVILSSTLGRYRSNGTRYLRHGLVARASYRMSPAK